MPQAQLYFLTDQYYQDFPDDKLMQNKDIINGTPHSRPCFFAFIRIDDRIAADEKNAHHVLAMAKRGTKITVIRLDHRLCRWSGQAPPGYFSVPPIGGV